jgi:hypothetical protein
MDKPKTTPKDFFLWAGAMVALYWSVLAFIFLMFDYINYAFPDPLRYYPSDPYQSGISFEMASLIVLFPIFVVIMWLIHREINSDHPRGEVWVRRWALILTLFLAALAMAIDLIYLLKTFFDGESLTPAFLLKVAIIFLIAAATFMHFIADYWGYWQQYPERGRSVGIAAVVLVLGTIVAGFLIIGTPAHARLLRFDSQKVSDLQSIQSQVVYYWQQKGSLPQSTNALNDSISNYVVPVDPQSGKAYEYNPINAHSFNLCATFNADSTDATPAPTVPLYPSSGSVNQNWAHVAGHSCFLRTIDPQLYPPNKTLVK